VENRTNVIAKTFDRITQVLANLGYLNGDRVTDSGKMLSKIYAESDLLIAETIQSGLLSKLSDIEIAAVLSVFLFESRKPEAPKIPNTQVQDALKEIVSIWSRLQNLEAEYDVKTQKEPDFGFCWIAFRWGGGHGLNSVLRNSDLSVGDFVRAIKQLIDLLNQVAGAQPELREKCLSAIKKMDRGVVIYLGGLA
jgi:ATP-dependent RNA helicase HelY